MAFRFRLQPLLDFRISQEEEARLRLAREIAQLERQRQALEKLGERRLQAIAAFEAVKGQAMSGARIALFFDAIAGLDAASEFQRRTIAAQEQVVEEARRELAQARKARRIIERLRERDLAAWQTEERLREQKEMDELVTLRFGRGESLLAGGGG